MKIEIGKRYKMRGHPKQYEYVQILTKASDVVPDEEGFIGCIVYTNSVLEKASLNPSLCIWSEKGSWDCLQESGLGTDCNDLVSEVV